MPRRRLLPFGPQIPRLAVWTAALAALAGSPSGLLSQESRTVRETRVDTTRTARSADSVGARGSRAPVLTPAIRSTAYEDPVARGLHEAAVRNWEYIDETVVRYTALVKSRMAAGIRTPLKDRTLYRSESASRVFWDRDRESIVQVLANREQTPVGVEAPEPSTAMDGFFDPAGDRLFFGMTRSEEAPDEEDDEFYVWHPLAPDAIAHYRFASGDTLTVGLADGRTIRAVELQVLPREADVHRITGSLWIEPESGALVRAAYRLADRFDAFRDIPDLREEEEEDLRFVPGLLKPWTFDLQVIVVDYGLWDFSVWLPRGMRIEGVATAGVVRAPMNMDVAYRIESVVTEESLAAEDAGEAPVGMLEERHFESREEAMTFLASLLEDDEGVRYRPDDGWTRRNDRTIRRLVPEDPERLHDSPHLPPPVWDDAPGFPSGDEIDRAKDLLADLPQASPARTFWAANWGLERPDLVRYNRVEGPALGARLQLRTGSPFGPVSLALEPYIGFADVEPKVTATATWEGLERRTVLAAYRRLDSAPRRVDAFGIGNSTGALLFGRDDGEYFMSTGASVALTPPAAERESWSVRIWAERHDPVDGKIDFSLSHAFDDDWRARPNLRADALEEAGGEVTIAPWWGSDPLAPQFGAELYLQGAATRGLADDAGYGRASALLRAAVPFRTGEWAWRAGVEVEAGQAWGTVPRQRNWFLGSTSTLRGYGPSTLMGESFGRARAELARVLPVASVALFADGGWTGDDLDALDTDDALFSLGVGVSVLDGLIRFDVARALREPKGTRVDFYLDSAF